MIENMNETEEGAAEAIVRRMKFLMSRGVTQTTLGTAADISQPTISKWLNLEKPKMTYENAVKMDRALRVFEEKILGNGDRIEPTPPHPRDPEPEPNGVFAGAVRFAPERLPIFGEAVAGDDGMFEFNGQVIDTIGRPPNLASVKSAYGVYVRGTSMYPRYNEGEVVHVNPVKPARPGHDVLVQILPEVEGDPPLGFIKRLVKREGHELILEQLNPPEGQDRLMRFPQERVHSVHRIVGMSED
ncbi:LexA family transcriptional regulator [Microvirga brassicacearum]|uniref:HTH cro/C1-type domain-containing protein n=1 Tax=Microvirga brassicacearum TaxID=2580413 RepID=A0A5N3PH88_9HYPH|nr:S24 family peptidase [Microvirga brassicacearum]KAB0269015.1 hypothetical protein FEZ63_02595 [Microvirga brassicacearum]